jgi:hypothetical protein
MAFSFGVEMLNMVMRKHATKQRTVRLNEPVYKTPELKETTSYKDMSD